MIEESREKLKRLVVASIQSLEDAIEQSGEIDEEDIKRMGQLKLLLDTFPPEVKPLDASGYTEEELDRLAEGIDPKRSPGD